MYIDDIAINSFLFFFQDEKYFGHNLWGLSTYVVFSTFFSENLAFYEIVCVVEGEIL